MRRAEDVQEPGQLPVVYLGWDRDLIAYGTNYGRGAYGYYAVRGNSDSGVYGNSWKVNMDSWSLYLQDSWTIARRLTLNLGLRAESEYLPSYTTDPLFADIKKPINFPFSKKLAPRLGFVYDILGDSSFKVFGSYGIFHDVMKLDMGANALGGFKWASAYYTLDDWDFTKIGVDDYYPGTLLCTCNFRPPVFEFHRSRHQAVHAAGDLPGAREKARGGHVPVPPPGQQEGPLCHRGLRRAHRGVLLQQPRQRLHGRDLRRAPPERDLPARHSRPAQGQARLLRHEPVARQALQPQLAGRPVLHAQPPGWELQRPGQLRRGRPQQPQRRALLRHVVSGRSTRASIPSTDRSGPTARTPSRPTAATPSPSA